MGGIEIKRTKTNLTGQKRTFLSERMSFFDIALTFTLIGLNFSHRFQPPIIQMVTERLVNFRKKSLVTLPHLR